MRAVVVVTFLFRKGQVGTRYAKRGQFDSSLLLFYIMKKPLHEGRVWDSSMHMHGAIPLESCVTIDSGLASPSPLI
jgi:hypothetical protein